MPGYFVSSVTLISFLCACKLQKTPDPPKFDLPIFLGSQKELLPTKNVKIMVLLLDQPAKFY